jgi:hypothetical protein
VSDDQAAPRPVYHRLDLTAEEFAAHKALLARVAELEKVAEAVSRFVVAADARSMEKPTSVYVEEFRAALRAAGITPAGGAE